MRAILTILFVAVFFACFTQQGKGTSTNNGVPLHTNFIADAGLDATELRSVVKLAKLCGMEQVAEVRTFHYLPTSYRGIEVTGADQISGRNITYKTLEIFREGWTYKPKPTGPLQTISVGPFWVEGLGIPATHTATLFNTVSGSVRVNVEAGISNNVADTIIRAFTSTNFLVRESKGIGGLEIGGVDRSLIERENLSRPDMLTKGETSDYYWIRFAGGLNYECVLSSNKVCVVSVRFPPTP